MEGNDLMHAVRAIVEEVAIFQRNEFKGFNSSHVKEKGLHDLVSYVDLESESVLRKGLLELLPGSSFLGEEEGKSAGSEWLWIVDPLDGTTNFVSGLPAFAVSVALYKGEKPQLGVVADVMAGQQFYAISGKGAWCNGETIHVSHTESMESALFATGYPVREFQRLPQLMHATEQFVLNSRGLRRFGAAALDLVWTASGRFSGFYETNLAPWDVAAGALIVKEAGGNITDFSGGNNWLYGGEIVASNSRLHTNMLEILQAKPTAL
jgi:myo-inositol-1(or 4)-monophosphatase